VLWGGDGIGDGDTMIEIKTTEPVNTGAKETLWRGDGIDDCDTMNEIKTTEPVDLKENRCCGEEMGTVKATRWQWRGDEEDGYVEGRNRV